MAVSGTGWDSWAAEKRKEARHGGGRERVIMKGAFVYSLAHTMPGNGSVENTGL